MTIDRRSFNGAMISVLAASIVPIDTARAPRYPGGLSASFRRRLPAPGPIPSRAWSRMISRSSGDTGADRQPARCWHPHQPAGGGRCKARRLHAVHAAVLDFHHPAGDASKIATRSGARHRDDRADRPAADGDRRQSQAGRRHLVGPDCVGEEASGLDPLRRQSGRVAAHDRRVAAATCRHQVDPGSVSQRRQSNAGCGCGSNPSCHREPGRAWRFDRERHAQAAGRCLRQARA